LPLCTKGPKLARYSSGTLSSSDIFSATVMTFFFLALDLRAASRLFSVTLIFLARISSSVKTRRGRPRLRRAAGGTEDMVLVVGESTDVEKNFVCEGSGDNRVVVGEL
jgi:hypothetical protein